MFQLANKDKTFSIINKQIDFDKEIQIIKDLHAIQTNQSENVVHPKLKNFDNIYQVNLHFSSNPKWASRCDIHYRYPINCWEQAKKCLVSCEDTPDYTITNTHQAKGMEFDNVAIAHDFKMVYNTENPSLVIESRNIFYTAITRVKKCLYVMNEMYKKEFIKPTLFDT